MDYAGTAYNLVKAGHILAVIAWMAGMLYLPRLFVYHVEAQKGSIQSETFKIMERRLLKAIINPAMILTWIFGLSLVWSMWSQGVLVGHWFDAKFLLVLIMSGVHGWFSKLTKDFANDRNVRPAKFYRMINEIPTVLMILIVILVVVKPF